MKYKYKVGDKVQIIKSKENWCDYMDKFVGRIVEITNVNDYYDEFQIKFKDHGGWTWTSYDKHFKLAKSEINYEIY
jgi:hypothetical protein